MEAELPALRPLRPLRENSKKIISRRDRQARREETFFHWIGLIYKDFAPGGAKDQTGRAGCLGTSF
jgi:hypothetical protein